MKKLIFVLMVLMVIGIVAWSAMSHPQSNNIKPASIADSISKYNLNIQKVRILINKRDYLLKLFIDGKLVQSYPVVFGPDPVNDKTHEGDNCTPEGLFKIKEKYPHKSWSYFLWIDYPNAESRKKFNENLKNGKIKKGASIGGEIGIHGVPYITSEFGKAIASGTEHADYLIDKKINWTAGCISLKTADITEIYKYCPVGADVEIVH